MPRTRTKQIHQKNRGKLKKPFVKVWMESKGGKYVERWGAGVEAQKNVRGEIGGWGRVPFNETYAPSLSTIYDGA